MSVVGLGCGGAALRRDKTVALELRSELAKSFRLIAGENERSLDGFESRAGGQAGAGGCGLGQGKLWGDRLIRIGFGRELRLWTKDVFDRRDTADGFLGEDPELKGKGASEFAFEIDGAAAHAGYDAGVLDFGAFQLDEDDGLLGAEKVGHDADHFEIEFFDLVTGEDGVGVALHARADLAEGQDFRGGWSLRVGRDECRRGDKKHDRKNEEAGESASHGQIRPSRTHEPTIIRGEVRGSNWTGGAARTGPERLCVLELRR